MSEFLAYTVIGLVTASVYAIAASGMVVTYATSGIFNFAHGAIAMFSAYVFWEVNQTWGVPWPVALALVVFVLAPLFGVVVERLLLRKLDGAPTVAKVVVTVGLLFGLLTLVPILFPPNKNRVIPDFFGTAQFDIGAAKVTQHQLVVIGLALVVAGLLRVVLFNTRAGVAMRAVVDSRDLSRLNGARPGRSSALSWAIGCGLAALAGILITDTLQVLVLTLLVFNAYAAAVVGRLTSLPMTFVGAVLLGLAQSYAIGYLPENPAWLSDLDINIVTPLTTAIPVVMLFIVLLALPHAPLRAGGITRSRESTSTPTMRRAMVGMGVLIGVACIGAATFSNSQAIAWGKGLALAIVVLSLVPLTGYGGQISLAQMSFAGLGAYAVSTWGGGGNPLGLVAAIVLAGAVGALVALPALRLQGIYLALATFAFAVFMDRVVFTQKALFEGGSKSVDRPELGPLTFESDQAYLILLAVMFAIIGLFVVWLRLGPFGRRLRAMKESPAACATLGMSLTRTKLAVFVLSAAIAGVGGAAYAGLQGLAQPAHYEVLQGLPILLVAVAGGIALVSGSLFGGLLLAAFAIVPTWIPSTWEIAGVNAQDLVGNLMLLGPAFLGISLGRNPNGAVHEISTRVGGLVNAGRREREAGEPTVETLLADVETMGIDHALGEAEIAAVDEVLGIDEEVIGAVARG